MHSASLYGAGGSQKDDSRTGAENRHKKASLRAEARRWGGRCEHWYSTRSNNWLSVTLGQTGLPSGTRQLAACRFFSKRIVDAAVCVCYSLARCVGPDRYVASNSPAVAVGGAVAKKPFGLCALAGCSPYNARTRGTESRNAVYVRPYFPFNALENTFVFGQSAERVVRSRLQADLNPEEGRSKRGRVVEVASPCRIEGRSPEGEGRTGASPCGTEGRSPEEGRGSHVFMQD